MPRMRERRCWWMEPRDGIVSACKLVDPTAPPQLLCSSVSWANLEPLSRQMADIRQQLLTLLSRDVKALWRTDETPPRVSIVDVAMAVSGGSQNNAAQALRRLSDQYPEVGANCPHLKFKGWGQRDTPVTDVRGIVEIVMPSSRRVALQVARW